jgi:hypothetical protein
MEELSLPYNSIEIMSYGIYHNCFDIFQIFQFHILTPCNHPALIGKLNGFF